MPVQRFRFKPAIPELPKGAERAIIEQFRSVQSDLDAVRGFATSATPVQSKDYNARVGQLVLIAPPAAGMKLTIPAGTAENITQIVRIAVVAGLLSPGAIVSIVGGEGTINGAPLLQLNSYRLVELVSCGPLGWFFST